MNLYNINAELQALTATIIANGGEVSEEQLQQLENLEMALETKCINMGYLVQKMENDCTTLDNEIKRLQAMKKARKNTQERLKGLISDAMTANDLQTVETETHKISFRKSQAVEIIDADSVPAEFKTIEQKINISKVELKKALKVGEVPGAKLVTNQNIQIK